MRDRWRASVAIGTITACRRAVFAGESRCSLRQASSLAFTQEERPMNASIPALAIAAVISAGCRQPVSPSTPISEAGSRLGTDAVPFKGSMEGTFTFVPDPAPSTFASVHLHVSGVATQLGQFTL